MKGALSTTAILYVFISLVTGFVAGVQKASDTYDGEYFCKITYRFDYILPARKLGCYLGEKVNEKTTKRSCQALSAD